jgi:hypothetical protein
MAEYLWKFELDFGRMGEVTSIFVATEEEIEEALGKQIYFGEILGKHSEVFCDLEREHLKKIEIDSDAVTKVVAELGRTWSGYNPLEYIDEEDDE